MRHTLFWTEMRELSQVLGVLAAVEALLVLGFRLLPAGHLPDGFLLGLVWVAAVALAASLGARDRRPATLPLLASLPVSRGRILAVRWTAGLASLLLVALGGVAACRLAAGWGWSWTPVLVPGPGLSFLAALSVLGAASWWLLPRARGFPAPFRRAPGLLAIEWRQKRVLLGTLALLPLLHLVGVSAGWLDPLSIFGWAWLSGAVLGASLFTAPERDASRSLLHMLPVARTRLAAGRLLGGLAAGGLFLAEHILVLWIEGEVHRVDDLAFTVPAFVFFYGGAFLIGAALSPWLRSTVATVLLALVSTWVVLLLLTLDGVPLDDDVWLWTSTGLALALLATVAGWSTMRSRAFEPGPRKDLRALLCVLALWLAAAGILALS
jgi:ABC-type transport system involved in multi-copper enzyme maturation permease subunit